MVLKKEQSHVELLNSYIEDLTETFCDDYIVPAYRHMLYMRTNISSDINGSSHFCKRLVEIARKEHATAICHGATGKGNDPVRFELGIKALAPDIKIIAAWRDQSGHSIPVNPRSNIAAKRASSFLSPVKNSYSRDRNL